MTEEFRINISASDNTNTAFASAERRLAGLTAAASTASSALNAIGVTVGAGAFVGFIKNSIDAADELSKLSQKTGIAVETLAGLRFAADQSGTTLDGVALGVKKLATFVSDAQDGNKQYQATLKALGITAKDPEKALVQLASAFERMPDGLRKTALAQELLGKSGIDLIPLLNGGADGLQRMIDRGRELNPITAQMAKEAEAFNDQLDELKAVAGAAGVAIAKDLLPSITALSTGLVAAQRSGTSFFTWLTTGGDEEKNAAARIDELSASLVRMKKQRDELSKPTVANKINDFVFGDVRDLNAQIQATEAKIAYLKNLKKTQDALSDDAAKKKTPLDFSSLNTGNDGAAAAAKAAAQRDASAIQSLRERLTATQNLTEVEKAGQEIANGRYKDLSVAAKRSLLEIAAQIDANKELNETQKQQQATEKQNSEEGIARFKALQAAGAAVYESTRTDAQKYSDEVIRLNDLLAQGAITQDTYNQAVLNAQDAYQKAADTAKATGDEMSQYAIQAARNQQTAFAQFLFDPFQDGVKGMASGFLNAIRQMAANAAAAHIFDSLFGKGSDSGLLGSLFNSAVGAFTGTKKFASGGDFGGGLRLVGEQGPELEVTGPSRIFNATQTRAMLNGGGGGDTINVSLNIQTGVAQTVRAEIISLMPAIQKQTVAAVAAAKGRNKFPGDS
jgi:hypothetical protein